MEFDFRVALPGLVVSEVWQDIYVAIVVFFVLHVTITVD